MKKIGKQTHHRERPAYTQNRNKKHALHQLTHYALQPNTCHKVDTTIVHVRPMGLMLLHQGINWPLIRLSEWVFVQEVQDSNHLCALIWLWTASLQRWEIMVHTQTHTWQTLSMYLSIHASICLSIYPCFYLFIYLPICISIYLFVDLSTCLSISQSVNQSRCMSTVFSPFSPFSSFPSPFTSPALPFLILSFFLSLLPSSFPSIRPFFSLSLLSSSSPSILPSFSLSFLPSSSPSLLPSSSPSLLPSYYPSLLLSLFLSLSLSLIPSFPSPIPKALRQNTITPIWIK